MSPSRIHDPSDYHRPSYITPVAAVVLGVVIGGLIGFCVAKISAPEQDCANIVRTADNIVRMDDQIFVQIATTGNAFSDEITLLKAQRKGYVDYYNQHKGECS